MIPEEFLKLSFEELALRGQKVIAAQPAITYAEAFAQVKRLKEYSKVNQASKKSRPSDEGVVNNDHDRL